MKTWIRTLLIAVIVAPGALWLGSVVTVRPLSSAFAQFPLTPNFSAKVNAPFYSVAVRDAATTGVSVKAAAGAGIRNYVTEAQCINSTASTVAVGQIMNGTTAGTGILTYIPCQAAGTSGPIMKFDPPLRGNANTAIGFAVSVSITTAYISVRGYTSPE